MEFNSIDTGELNAALAKAQAKAVAVAFDADGSPLSDELALRTLQMGGRVLAVEADRVPDGLSMVAILRY